MIAIFPGSFDPLTNGHLDIIRRGLQVADKIIVAIGTNPSKDPLFTIEERIEMIRTEVTDILYLGRFPREAVEITSYDGLTGQYAMRRGASFILRGIRDNADLNYEMQNSGINKIVGSVETVFLLASGENSIVSSTYIKQIVKLGCRDLNRLKMLVPERVAKKLLEKIL